MDELNISVEEVCKTIHKSHDFVINAVQQGMMPGAVVVSKTGIRSVHIPRKAFEAYMNEWNTSPTDKIIQALFKKYTKKQCLSCSQAPKARRQIIIRRMNCNT